MFDNVIINVETKFLKYIHQGTLSVKVRIIRRRYTNNGASGPFNSENK